MGHSLCVFFEKFFFTTRQVTASSSLLCPPSGITGTRKPNLFLPFIGNSPSVILLEFLHWKFEGWLRGFVHSVQCVVMYPTLSPGFSHLLSQHDRSKCLWVLYWQKSNNNIAYFIGIALNNVPGTVLSDWHILSHLIFTTTLWIVNRYCDYLHFPMRKWRYKRS